MFGFQNLVDVNGLLMERRRMKQIAPVILSIRRPSVLDSPMPPEYYIGIDDQAIKVGLD